MGRILRYFDPIAHLGDARYSFVFPLITNIVVNILSEIFTYNVAKNPMAVGTYIIFLHAALIIYFAFRSGIIGGLTTSLIAIAYYFYIVVNRHYHGQTLSTGIETILILSVLYLLLAFIIGWLKQTIDIFIEREANEKIRLRTILDQLAVGVIVTDNQGRVTLANRYLEKITGTNIPMGFVIGKDENPVKSINNGIIVKPIESPLYESLQSGKSVFGKEFNLYKKSGKKIVISINSSVIRNKKNDIIAAASIITDMTHQKELERQKDDFLNMASHELRTPITSLRMFIDLQKRQFAKKGWEKAKYFNNRIQDQANQLKELVNDLLDVSRIQTDKLYFDKEKFNLAETIKDGVEGLQEAAKQNKIVIEQLDNAFVKGDKYRLYQVLVNLITNSVKYSGKGKKIIVRVKKNTDNVVVSIRDFGIGIDKNKQKKIFEKLYQVTDPKEKTFPGLGLGLYISREIILRHEGKIWVESAKGKGSTFYFSLPLVNDELT